MDQENGAVTVVERDKLLVVLLQHVLEHVAEQMATDKREKKLRAPGHVGAEEDGERGEISENKSPGKSESKISEKFGAVRNAEVAARNTNASASLFPITTGPGVGEMPREMTREMPREMTKTCEGSFSIRGAGSVHSGSSRDLGSRIQGSGVQGGTFMGFLSSKASTRGAPTQSVRQGPQLGPGINPQFSGIHPNCHKADHSSSVSRAALAAAKRVDVIPMNWGDAEFAQKRSRNVGGGFRMRGKLGTGGVMPMGSKDAGGTNENSAAKVMPSLQTDSATILQVLAELRGEGEGQGVESGEESASAKKGVSEFQGEKIKNASCQTDRSPSYPTVPAEEKGREENLNQAKGKDLEMQVQQQISQQGTLCEEEKEDNVAQSDRDAQEMAVRNQERTGETSDLGHLGFSPPRKKLILRAVDYHGVDIALYGQNRMVLNTRCGRWLVQTR